MYGWREMVEMVANEGMFLGDGSKQSPLVMLCPSIVTVQAQTIYP